MWSQGQAEYQISDIGGREILTQACELLDRVERLRAEIDRDGEIIRTKNGPRVHPGINQETHLPVAIGKMLDRLGLNLEPVKPHGGQPRTMGWTGERWCRHPPHADQPASTSHRVVSWRFGYL